MRRRTLLKGLPAAVGVAGFGTTTNAVTAALSAQLPALTVRTPCSLTGVGGGTLDDSLVAVWSEPTASSTDADGNADAAPVESDRLPLVAVDGRVAGFGGPLVTDHHDFAAGNEEFLINLWDDLLGGGTVVWEEAHDQEYSFVEDYDQFKHYAIEQGYQVEATESFADALEAADGVVIAAPQDSYSDTELTRLQRFVESGGALFVHDRSDAEDADGTAQVNAICERLGVGFRFNDDSVVDTENNAGERTHPTTAQFNTAFPYFSDRQGLSDFSLDAGQTYVGDVIDVADGDTVDIRFDNGTTETIRVLGVDTPETQPNDRFERPEEWEGLAYDYTHSRLETLRFEDACSLGGAGGGPLTDDSMVAVWAESTATVEENDGEGPTVDYADLPIPLVGVDGRVVGIGATMVGADPDFEADNEEFLINVWNHFLGTGTILWDEGHDQFFTLDKTDPLRGYADDNNYSLVGTDALTDDLPTADGVVITAPSRGFSEEERDALASFVADGGAVFLHDQADYRDFDGTTHLNELAAALDVGFRFNDDQVIDAEENDGKEFQPVTTNFSDAYPAFFRDRAGADGGAIDRTSDHLLEYAAKGKAFARERLADRRIRIAFDGNESVRDQFDRVLAYVYYDADDGGSRDRLYNEELVQAGLARVYGSGMAKHRSFWLAEADARAAGRGVWTASDISAAPSYRNRAVESVFVPSPASVRTADGPLSAERAPVRAASTATQSGGDAIAYEESIPLVGVDPAMRVALVGGPLIEESFEQFEGYAVDTSIHENYVLVSNLIAGLTDREGDVLIDGGHGQFGADHAASSEDAAYYQRFLEGQGFTLEQRNELSTDTLNAGRALIVTMPQSAITERERAAIASFRDSGGAVILMASGEASDDERGYLNDLAAALGTDLRVNADEVTDPENALNEDPGVFVTRAFASDYGGLFDAYDGAVSLPARARREDDAAGTTTASTATPGGPTTAGQGPATTGGGNGGSGGGDLLLPGIAGGALATGLAALGLWKLTDDDGGND